MICTGLACDVATGWVVIVTGAWEMEGWVMREMVGVAAVAAVVATVLNRRDVAAEVTAICWTAAGDAGIVLTMVPP